MRVPAGGAYVVLAAGLLVATATGLARYGRHGGHDHAGPGAATAPICSGAATGATDRFAQEMGRAMAAMMRDMHASPATGDPDRDFLAMMVPHHQGAVDMARLVLAHGRDPLTRQLAEHILATQQVEIVAMAQRLKLLEQGPPDAYPALSGTRSP
jgi:hypothetical protein